MPEISYNKSFSEPTRGIKHLRDYLPDIEHFMLMMELSKNIILDCCFGLQLQVEINGKHV